MAKKIPNWSRCSEKKHDRVGQQRAKVNHSADSDEKKQRQCLGSLDSGFEQPLNNTACFSHTLCYLINCSGERKIDKNGAKAHGQQQCRLTSFFDCHVNQADADQIHDTLLPCDSLKSFQKKIHKNTPLH